MNLRLMFRSAGPAGPAGPVAPAGPVGPLDYSREYTVRI